MSEGDPEAIVARISGSVRALDPDLWDACAGPGNPFLSHRFLSILEESGSATAEAGWQPLPVSIADDAGKMVAVAPAM